MAEHEQVKKESRVVKVDSEDSWDFFISQATIKGCPVSLLILFFFFFCCDGLNYYVCGH